MPGTGGQKLSSDHLELEVQMVVSLHGAGAGIEPGSSERVVSALNVWVIISSVLMSFNLNYLHEGPVPNIILDARISIHNFSFWEVKFTTYNLL